MRIARPATLLVLGVLWTAGCTRFVDEPSACSTERPCQDGQTCENGTCVPIRDASDAEQTFDVPADGPDLPVDAFGEASDIPGADAMDAVPDAELPDAPIELPDALTDGLDAGDGSDAADAPPIDVPAGSVGSPCSTDTDCLAGPCVPWNSAAAASPKVCTGPCTGGCPTGLQCQPTGDGDATTCGPLPLGLCAPCVVAGDCATSGAQCIDQPGGGRACAAPCGDDRPCPVGFACAFLEDSGLPEDLKRQCLPKAGGCTCNKALDGQLFPCSLGNDLGSCTGQRTCDPATGWSACSAPAPIPETCNNRDDDCDGQTDESFQATDWDGSARKVGETCGTGRCASGLVECGPDGQAACSSTGQALATEACGTLGGDGVDDDCDGITDEGCGSTDRDGDRTLNDEDCAADDAARHPGAPEACCPNDTPPSETVARCDFNCDGQVTSCAPDDLDGDGHSPPTDCADSDPAIHPGAAEKCDDDVDQDCSGADVKCCAPTDTECQATGFPVDKDGDGYVGRFDCSDTNPDVHPGAVEMCNFADDDCDGLIDEGSPSGYVDEARPELGVNAGGSDCGPVSGECRPGHWTCVHYPPYGRRMECLDGVGPTLDRCDDLDNDCDGQTDEDFLLKGQACDGDDLDQCANGTWQCARDGRGLDCIEAPGRIDIVEDCGNQLDDDCDGVVNNGCFPSDLDGDGEIPPGDCDDTRAEIYPGAEEPCCDPALSGQAALKQCDRNCDGRATPCSAEDRDNDGYRGIGHGGNDCDDSDPRVRPGAPEKCGDTVDQDCDGTDTACADLDHDDDGFAGPADCDDSSPAVNPWASERCNGEDDDCDGTTDEGNPDADGAPCGSTLGECQTGVEVCIRFPGGARIECMPRRGPRPEACNGLDDNCNGRTDEAFPDLGLPCDGPDSDLCGNGTGICKADGSGVECTSELAVDIAETCNRKDDDCDLEVDEGFAYAGQPLGAACEGEGDCGPGLVQCSRDGSRAICSTNWGGSDWQGALEECDGEDNDCDGAVDNGMLYAGQAVGDLCLGAGTCGLGVVECNPVSRKANCSTNPGGSNPEDLPEVCDSLDNDCDGHIDDGVTPSIFDCRRKGLCAGRTIPAECLKGKWVCDYSNVPGFEDEETACDGIDNDCDGTTDEGFAVNEPCDGPDGDRCMNGRNVCTGDKQDVECGTETEIDITESCNGSDDDCDGDTDEDYPLDDPCDGEDTDQCMNGTYTCRVDGTGAECVNEFDTDIPDTCNGLDDNCDGSTDEDFPGRGNACDGSDDDHCPNGKMECTVDGAGLECVGDEIGTPTVEVCDGLDNDCDDAIDEDFSYDGVAMGLPCDGIGECGTGIVVCSNSGLVATCSTNADGPVSQAEPEDCDGKDDDCDGGTDEELNWNGVPLGTECIPPGVCGPGTVVCSPGSRQATCSSIPEGARETCNGQDDDCDGTADNLAPDDKSTCKVAGICTPALVVAQCEAGGLKCDYSQLLPYGYVDGDETACNGLDDNCDGGTDESFQDLGMPCDGADTDQCKNGTFVCNLAGTGVECGIESPSDINEECGDGVDNDCDGLTDEADAEHCLVYFLDGDEDTYGVAGDQRCLCAPGDVANYTAMVDGDCDDATALIHPGADERCNGLDDNCNGGTDEGAAFADKGMPCDAVDDTDTCRNGTWVCAPDGTGLVCPDDYTWATEGCNGRDDNCDGQTDEGFPVGEACDGNDSDSCKNGTFTCTPDGGNVECATETVLDILEVCNNGKDDDCDGASNEEGATNCVVYFYDYDRDGFGVTSNSKCLCSSGQVALYTTTADGDCNDRNLNIRPAATEKCNNLDDDCDGTTDDPWPTRGYKCDINPTSAVPCETGRLVCDGAATGLVCTGHFDCATGSTCQPSGAPDLGDECGCGPPPNICTTDVANLCTPQKVCKCGANPACTGGQTCVLVGGATYSCQ